MTSGDMNRTVRVIGASRRMAYSERGWRTAVEYIVEGEPGTHMDFLDDFLEEYTDVKVADQSSGEGS